MRFLTISKHSAGHGGYERHRRMSRALLKRGHEVVWLAPGISANVGEDFLPLIKKYSWLPGPLGWILQLRSNLLYYRERLKGVDAVFTTREYDAFGCIIDLFVGNLPHIFFLHGDTIECEKYLAKHSERMMRRLKSRVMLCFYPWLQRKILNRFSHVVVQADFLAETLRTRHPNVDCEYIVLESDCLFEWHPEKVNQKHLTTIKALRASGKYIVGIIAQVFYKAKGFDVFLDAMTHLRGFPEIHAVIIGYGDEADLIPATIKRLDLSHQVTFLGQSSAAHYLMPFIDVIVSPTQFFDAFPTVILEAMEANCCIIGSDIKAHKAQLKYDTLMFPNSDAMNLAKRLSDLYTDVASRRLNCSLVKERRKKFQFDWDAKIIEIFESRISK